MGQRLEGSKAVVVVHGLGRTEIQQQGLTAGPKQHVGRFDIEVDHPLLVHTPESITDGWEYLLQKAPVKIPGKFVDEPAQVAAFLVCHHHVKRVVRLEVFGNADDVGMAYGTHPLRLKTEFLEAVAERCLRQWRIGLKRPVRFTRHKVLGTVLLDHELVPVDFIAGEIHQAEPAATKDLSHRVTLEHITGLEGKSAGHDK